MIPKVNHGGSIFPAMKFDVGTKRTGMFVAVTTLPRRTMRRNGPLFPIMLGSTFCIERAACILILMSS